MRGVIGTAYTLLLTVTRMWIALGIILVLAWLAGAFVFNIAGWLIHLLLVLAVISFLIRLIRGT